MFSCLRDGAGSRAPVIVSHVMPPTPPASSAPAEAPINEVQDKPLDLSKQRYRRAVEEETTADVEIISMTTQVQAQCRPSAFVSNRYPPHPVAPSQAPLKSVTQSRSIRDTNPIQQSLRSSRIVPVEWNRSSSFRSVRSTTERSSQQPTVLPNFRLHPYQGHGHYSQVQRDSTHPEVQTANLSSSFSPRYFHPQQIAGIKQSIAPLAPISSVTTHPITNHLGLVLWFYFNFIYATLTCVLRLFPKGIQQMAHFYYYFFLVYITSTSSSFTPSLAKFHFFPTIFWDLCIGHF